MSLDLTDVWFRYEKSSRDVLSGVNLQIPRGQSCAVMAPSGEGKTTLLNVAGALTRPTAGQVCFDGVDVNAGSNALRAPPLTASWILQAVNVLPRRTILDNVALPLHARGVPDAEANERAMVLLERLNIAELAAVPASKVSGGQAQRAAIARALVSEPLLLLADEPTASLDHGTAMSVMEALLDAHGNAAVMVATHDARIAALADRVVWLVDGRVEDA